MLIHGWPGSIVEFLDVMEKLANPRAYGGDPAEAFHLVVPSIPGFGFSIPLSEPGWTVGRTAGAFLWKEIREIDRAGYSVLTLTLREGVCFSRSGHSSPHKEGIPMVINGIDMLRNQRFLLEAAPERRMDFYKEMVAEPLRPFWESMLAKMPQGQDTTDPARLMGVYTPDLDDKVGIEAISWLERTNSWHQCLEAIEQAERLLRPEDNGIFLDKLLYSLVLANPAKFGHLHGYTGFGGTPGQAIVLV
ncbi:MAG: Soluble epoxide hydrolase, partial [Paenibacillus sp.]|nr:Soluble epoxide hydrolase [Paenibacillus sp.]